MVFGDHLCSDEVGGFEVGDIAIEPGLLLIFVFFTGRVPENVALDLSIFY